MEPGEGQDSQEAVEDRLESIVSLLFAAGGKGGAVPSLSEAAVPATKEDMEAARDYTLARKIDRYQAQDVMADVLEDYVELSGDGKARARGVSPGGGGSALVVLCGPGSASLHACVGETPRKDGLVCRACMSIALPASESAKISLCLPLPPCLVCTALVISVFRRGASDLPFPNFFRLLSGCNTRNKHSTNIHRCRTTSASRGVWRGSAAWR